MKASLIGQMAALMSSVISEISCIVAELCVYTSRSTVNKPEVTRSNRRARKERLHQTILFLHYLIYVRVATNNVLTLYVDVYIIKKINSIRLNFISKYLTST